MFCENCGNPLPEDSKFCLSCGVKIAGTESGGQALQESAVAVDTVKPDSAAAAETVLLEPEELTAPAEPIKFEPQPKPVPPADQPSPAKPVPQPEPSRYAPPQPAPQAPINRQPAPQAPINQQPAPQAKTYPQSAAPMGQLEIPKAEKPLPTWKFIGMMILTNIPIIGLIMVLVWSFGSSWNRNTKSYARALLILGIISFLLMVAGVIINLEAIRTLVDYFNSNFEIGVVG